MEKEKTLVFGRKYRVGNFFVFKFNKVLRKSDVAELRKQMGIPDEYRSQLQRAKLPFVKVEAVSGVWSVDFCCNTAMYQFLDTRLASALDAADRGVKLESNTVADFAHMFSIMFMDTTILGDNAYHVDKAVAVKAFVERQKAADISDEQDAAILDDMRKDDEARAAIVDMAGHISKEGGDDVKR